VSQLERGVSVTIELSQAQIDQILREVTGAPPISVLMQGIADAREVLASISLECDTGLSRSLLIGLAMLAAFPTDGSYIRNSEMAAVLAVTPSTAHRYISTLVAVGLVERDPTTRCYRLARAL
jgi:DNA-binding MarR family transcriptional regulator